MEVRSIAAASRTTDRGVAVRGDVVWQRARRRRIPFEFALATGSLTMIVAALIDSAAFTPHDTGDRLTVMAAAIGVFCVVAGWQSGLAVAAVGYLIFDGFLANRYGELTWDHKAGFHGVSMIALAAALGVVVHRLRSSPYRTPHIIRPSSDHTVARSSAIDGTLADKTDHWL